MFRTTLKRVVPFLLLAVTFTARAADFGTAAEAKAMLEKAVKALKADKAAINKPMAVA